MWQSFDKFVTSDDFRREWIVLLNSLAIDSTAPIAVISQNVVYKMLQNIIIKMIPKDDSTCGKKIELSVDEEQAIRFTCGYVVRAMKKKVHSSLYHNILDRMHIDEDLEISDGEDFLTYTKNGLLYWIEVDYITSATRCFYCSDGWK